MEVIDRDSECLAQDRRTGWMSRRKDVLRCCGECNRKADDARGQSDVISHSPSASCSRLGATIVHDLFVSKPDSLALSCKPYLQPA